MSTESRSIQKARKIKERRKERKGEKEGGREKVRKKGEKEGLLKRKDIKGVR